MILSMGGREEIFPEANLDWLNKSPGLAAEAIDAKTLKIRKAKKVVVDLEFFMVSKMFCTVRHNCPPELKGVYIFINLRKISV